MRKLTKQESELLHWLAAGYTRRQTMIKMAISSRVYDRLMASARNKLEARNVVEAMGKAFLAGIVW